MPLAEFRFAMLGGEIMFATVAGTVGVRADGIWITGSSEVSARIATGRSKTSACNIRRESSPRAPAESRHY
jgi:hypothetical protein